MNSIQWNLGMQETSSVGQQYTALLAPDNFNQFALLNNSSKSLYSIKNPNISENSIQHVTQQPKAQITMQPLIKPIQITRNQPVQAVAPIVYSFGQSDYNNRYIPDNQIKKIPWNKGENGDGDDNVIKSNKLNNAKENVMDLKWTSLQDIMEPKKSVASAKSQYLSVSRYIAGQTTDLHGKNGINNFNKKAGDMGLSSIFNDSMLDFQGIPSGKQRTLKNITGNAVSHGRTDWAAKYLK